MLKPCIDRGWPVIVHPDAIEDASLWSDFGALLCMENMDKRKHTGRTAGELAPFFESLPRARLCFDIAHARQVDPTLSNAREILRMFGDRLAQVHISELDSAGRHERLSMSMVVTVQSLIARLRPEAPAIIESQIASQEIQSEIEMVRKAFSAPSSARVGGAVAQASSG